MTHLQIEKPCISKCIRFWGAVSNSLNILHLLQRHYSEREAVSAVLASSLSCNLHHVLGSDTCQCITVEKAAETLVITVYGVQSKVQY